MDEMNEIRAFLKSGKPQECRNFLESYFDKSGYDRLSSLMIRLYIITDVYLAAEHAAADWNVDEAGFEKQFGNPDEAAEKLNTLTKILDYYENMFRVCIGWRDRTDHSETCASIEKAKYYVRDHFNDPELTLGKTASAVGLSPAYFSSMFGRYEGVSFITYLNNLRLNEAEKQLRNTDSSVSEIADDVGFRDYRYFSLKFKNHTGETPSAFRKEHK